jgi:hypothetical protein
VGIDGRPLGSALLAMAAALWTGAAEGDLIRLKNGGELRGLIERGEKPDDGNVVLIVTLSGTQIEVAREEIEFLARRSLTVENYETRARLAADTVEAQWELAEWCRVNQLNAQRETHLERVLDLDPDHAEAHRALGHIHHEGQWTTRDELMQARGYVKHKGRYITPQELELIETSRAERDSQRDWYQKIRLWHGWLANRDAERQAQGLTLLREIDHPDAVRALVNFFANDDAAERRTLLVEILSQIPGDKPVEPLVRRALYDVEAPIRRAAQDAITAERAEAALPHFLKALVDDQNVVVRRAAAALKELGKIEAVPHLIDALVTTHKYRVRVVDNSSTYSFGSDGSFQMGGRPIVLPPEIERQLLTGQLPNGVIVVPGPGSQPTKVVTVRRVHKNSEAHAALVALTGQDFGYDERNWGLWWSANKQVGGPTSAPL